MVFTLLAPPAQAGDDNEYVPGQVLVKLQPGTNPADVAATNGLNPTPLGQFGTRPIYLMAITDGALPPDKAEALLADSRILLADPNFIGQTPERRQRSVWVGGGDEGGYADQWAPDTIHLNDAHTVTEGAGVIVAVLDTGVDRDHPALAGRLLEGRDFVSDDNDPSEEGGRNDLGYGHGTHVAGLVALAAPGAKILPIRILQPDGTGNEWVLIEALEYVVNYIEPGTGQRVGVINFSFSFLQESDLLEDVIEDLTCDDDGGGNDLYLTSDEEDDEDEGEESDDEDEADAPQGDDDECLAIAQKGIVFVAAAGNSASTTPEYPAGDTDVPGLLAIAASTRQDSLATFSNRGPWVDVAAPGEEILSSVPNGEYGAWSGTSMAAPLTAGTAALVRAANPQMTATDAANHLLATAVTINSPVPLRIDAGAALGVAPRPQSQQLFLPLVVNMVGATTLVTRKN